MADSSKVKSKLLFKATFLKSSITLLNVLTTCLLFLGASLIFRGKEENYCSSEFISVLVNDHIVLFAVTFPLVLISTAFFLISLRKQSLPNYYALVPPTFFLAIFGFMILAGFVNIQISEPYCKSYNNNFSSLDLYALDKNNVSRVLDTFSMFSLILYLFSFSVILKILKRSKHKSIKIK